MKQFVFRLLFVVISALPLAMAAQINEREACRLGLQYQISRQASWGHGYPVIQTIEPNGAAAIAGLRVGDIIEAVDGRSTSGMSDASVSALLKSRAQDHVIRYSRFGAVARELLLRPVCQSTEMISEEQLARAFAFYSIEDESTRRLIYPFTLRVADKKLEGLSTFAFAASPDAATESIDNEIYKRIAVLLEAKGLRLNSHNPDFVVDCFYATDQNMGGSSLRKEVPAKTWRYSPDERQMLHMPFLPVGAPEAAASNLLKFGLRFLNARNTNETIWQCTANELLSAPMDVVTYAGLSLPMMLAQFPFVRTPHNPNFLITTRRYYYTGIMYRAGDLASVADVKEGSPAFKSGIRPGDRILSINAIPLKGYTLDAVTDSYRKFVDYTVKFRDRSTLFTDANGVRNCSYWDVNEYAKIAKTITGGKYKTAFAYLFFFRPYINQQDISSLVFFVERNGAAESVIVRPDTRNDTFFTID